MKRLIPILCLLLALPAAASDCIPSGTTDQYTYFVAVDSTDFTTRETGLSSFTVYRSRDGGAATAFTTPTINETSSANMPGVYELLLDEDMTIGASNTVEHMSVHITATGMAAVTKEFCISTIDADLATVDSNVDAVLVDTGTTLDGALATVDSNVDAILVDTGTTIPASLTTIDNEIAVIDGVVDNILVDTGTTLDGALATVDSNVDAILVDTGTSIPGTITTVDSNVDAILVDTGTTIPGTITTIDNEIAVIDGIVDNLALEQHVTTIATLSTQTSFTLTAGSADADAYNGWEIIVIDSATATQVAVGVVQDYAVTTRTVTLMVDPGVFTMAVGDTAILRPANTNVRQMNGYEVTGDGTTGTEWSGTGDGGL